MPAKMSIVRGCSARECAYNANDTCHELAITAGEGIDSSSGTPFYSPIHGGVQGLAAGVGTCKVTECRKNAESECVAGAIQVGLERIQPEKEPRRFYDLPSALT